MLDIQFFRTPFATVTKSYRGDNGEMYVEGIASSTNLDQTKERMSPEVIKLMAAKFTGKPLNSEHHNDWDDELGKIVQSDVQVVDGKPALWIKAKLNDWLTRSKDLFNGINDGKLQLGFSVEGKINPGGLVKELDSTTGQYVPVYRDIEPGAVAVTNKPANLDTFCNAVTKSINVEELPEAKQGSYIVVRKVIDGVPEEDTVCKDELCEHKKCLNKTCKNFCEKCGVAMNKDVDLGQDKDLALKDDQTLDCDHSVCPHGLCTDKVCKNMCKVCTMAKMDTQAAGPVPNTLLSRQDLEGKKHSDKTSAEKAEAPGEENADNSNIYNPSPGQYCTHDYCEHGNCMEGACPNKCSVCSTRQELKDGENKIDGAPASNTAVVGKDITNAHNKKPSKYQDVPEGKFLDPENHKYPADAKHLPAALAYFNHDGQRSAGGYSSDKWATMGSKLAGLLGGGYHYDASSEKVVNSNSDGDAKKSVTEGGELNDMLQHNNNVLQKTPYSQEVLDIIKAWGGNNPGNYDMLAKADASAVSQADVQKTQFVQTQSQAPVQQVVNGQVQPQQTVQKGSSSSSGDSSSTDSSSGSSDSGSSDSSSGSSSSGQSLSSLLSDVLTTLSDMKSSVSGSSSDSSTDSSGSTSTSDKTSTDKNFPPKDASSVSSDSNDSYDDATKALSLALTNFQQAIEKAKKQPQDGKFAENGTQHAGAASEGKDAVNGPAQEPNETQAQHAKVSMPKGNTGSSDNVNGKPQEPDYNSLATKSMVANQEKFVKSIDVLTSLMTRIGEKVQAVEGKVEALPGVRKGIAIDKQFTEEEKAEFAKSETNRRDMEAKLLADPKVDFKALHQFRTYGTLPAWFQQSK